MTPGLKVVTFKSENQRWDDEVHADTIKMLEEWLEDARAGKFDAVAVVGIDKTGDVETCIAQHNQHPALVGAVALLLARLTRQSHEDQD